MKTIPLTLTALTLCAAAHASPVTEITDGKEWRAAVSGGPNVRMTLHPDGSGRVRVGPIGRNVTWYANDTGLCITNLPGGDDPRCFVLSQTADGYLMTSGDGSTIGLTRR